MGSGQERFVEKVNQNGKTSARLVHVPRTKHEIFNSASSVLEPYWEEILGFFAKNF